MSIEYLVMPLEDCKRKRRFLVSYISEGSEDSHIDDLEKPQGGGTLPAR